MVTSEPTDAAATSAVTPIDKVSPTPEIVKPKPKKPSRPYALADAKIMCFSFEALEQMANLGGGTAYNDMPEVQTQLRMLSSFGRNIHLPRVAGAAATTVASFQQDGVLDPTASGTLGAFCAGMPAAN